MPEDCEVLPRDGVYVEQGGKKKKALYFPKYPSAGFCLMVNPFPKKKKKKKGKKKRKGKKKK